MMTQGKSRILDETGLFGSYPGRGSSEKEKKTFKGIGGSKLRPPMNKARTPKGG